MVFITTCNNISVISWRSVLLVEEIGEKHRPVASHWQFFYHIMLYWVHLAWEGGSVKANYTSIRSRPRRPQFVMWLTKVMDQCIYFCHVLFFGIWILKKKHCLGYHKNLFKNLNYVSEKYYFRINWSYYKYIIHYLSFMYLCSLNVKHQSINQSCICEVYFILYGCPSF